MSTSLGLVRNGDIIDLPAAEVAKIRVMKPMALEELPELDLPKEAAKKKAPAKRKPDSDVRSTSELVITPINAE